MTSNELKLFRKLVKSEIEKRKKVNEILQNYDIKDTLEEYLLSEDHLDPFNTYSIVEKVLKGFFVTKSNKIYVCTLSVYEDESGVKSYYNPATQNINISYKRYVDIESREIALAGPSVPEYSPLYISSDTQSFENKFIVLNPDGEIYSEKKKSAFRNNGYYRIRQDFFEACLENTQKEAIKMILKKTPRIK